jgi:hypothetical protein
MMRTTPGTTFLLLLALAPPAGATRIAVTTLTDPLLAALPDGQCSLREALLAADTDTAPTPGPGECPAGSATDRISFTVAGTIVLNANNGPLPTLGSGGPVRIDGWSAPGAGPGLRPTVAIDGTFLGGSGGSAAGLTLSTSDNVVRGLAFMRFGIGISIDGDHNWILGNHVGTNPAGTAARPNGVGLFLIGSHNLIGTNGDGARDAAEGNLISGNATAGVLLSSVLGCVGNRLAGNRIGTDRAGGAPLPNQSNGVEIGGGCSATIIGTDSSGDAFDAGEGNLISGNAQSGILEGGSSGTVIAGNRIGTRRDGQVAIANSQGIVIEEVATAVRIGTDGDGISDPTERNLISGNTAHGVSLHGADALVAGNFIGTDPNGGNAVANGLVGVAIDNGSGAGGIGGPVMVGGPGAVFRNLISGNGGDGITALASDLEIRCNFIGADVNGANLGNGSDGVVWTGGGGVTTIEMNRIGFNARGLLLADGLTLLHNSIGGNTVGLESSAPVVLDMRQNWWNASNGPLAPGNPAGFGDSIVLAPGAGGVLYNPWDPSDLSTCN